MHGLVEYWHICNYERRGLPNSLRDFSLVGPATRPMQLSISSAGGVKFAFLRRPPSCSIATAWNCLHRNGNSTAIEGSFSLSSFALISPSKLSSSECHLGSFFFACKSAREGSRCKKSSKPVFVAEKTLIKLERVNAKLTSRCLYYISKAKGEP